MKKSLIIICLLCLPFLTRAQAATLPGLEAYFSAFIVKDIDASIKWYENVLGFNMVNKVASKERGFKQANLKRQGILIELIELDDALSPKDVVPNYHNKTRLVGIFKTGFIISDFNTWMAHLVSKKAKFYGDIVTDEDTGKKMAILLDPDGNRIQFFEK